MSLRQEEESLLKELVRTATAKAPEFREFTGTIGELLVCKKYGYDWDPSEGYDAKDNESNRRVQIKTRKLSGGSTNFNYGTMGRFGKHGNVDGYEVGILVKLDHDFNIEDLWKREQVVIKCLEQSKKPGRGLHVGTFVKGRKREPAKCCCDGDCQKPAETFSAA